MVLRRQCRVTDFMWPFFASLVALVGLSAIVRDLRIAGTAAILLVNWALCTAVVQQTGDAYPWTWFFAVDYLSAFVVLSFFGKPNIWQGMVGTIYAAQLICHAARGLYLNSAAGLYYGYYFLKWSSWAQLAVVAVCGIYELARRSGMFARSPSSVEAGNARFDRSRS